MAFRCGFFTSVNGDRKYGVDDVSKLITSVISSGVVADDKFSDGLQVQAYEGLKIVVKKGIGIFFNKWCENDADMFFTVPTPDVTSTRVDSIVIRVDISDDVRNGFLEYKTGESNTPPALENSENVKEYRLANITVAPNVSAITQADIEDTRPTEECGFVTNLLQNSDITATYSQWQEQFNQWFEQSKNAFDETQEENKNTFDTTQEQNQNEFDSWFTNVKETLSSNTLISSFTSKYVTTSQDETVIPIGIEKYKSVLDILQVYINGLLCFKDTDYTIDGFNNIILTKGVDKGTVIHFVVYKSQDGSNVENFVEDLNDLIERQESIENDFNSLETSLNTTKNGINTSLNDVNTKVTNNTTKITTLTSDMTKVKNRLTSLEQDPYVLWSGGLVMGANDTITLSKKVSECRNGIILCWCGYNNGSYSNTRFNFITVPKGALFSLTGTSIPVYNHLVYTIYESGTFEECVKRVDVFDNKIVGFVGNSTETKSAGMCLRFVIEY
jgi:hypothetical protein